MSIKSVYVCVQNVNVQFYVATQWGKRARMYKSIVKSLIYCTYILGMCIFHTKVNAICILMRSRWYDTLKIPMKHIPMRSNAYYPYYDAVRSDSIRYNTMWFNAIRCNQKIIMEFNMVPLLRKRAIELCPKRNRMFFGINGYKC